jgi:hypothetical protein
MAVAPVLQSRLARIVSDAGTSAAETTRPFQKRIAAGVYARSRQDDRSQVAGPEMIEIFQGSSKPSDEPREPERVRSATDTLLRSVDPEMDVARRLRGFRAEIAEHVFPFSFTLRFFSRLL